MQADNGGHPEGCGHGSPKRRASRGMNCKRLDLDFEGTFESKAKDDR
jgi:hypothetical protein